MTVSDTKVSLPAHLRSILEPLPDILPDELCQRLSPYLLESCSEIPHSLLLDISKWVRTDEARSKLHAQKLAPSDYGMISLLAGTITSPSSNFPSYVPPLDAAEEAKRATNDRKALTAIVNALLSIGGAGYAGWWASGRTGWRDEWRVLFAMMIASVIAISEALLYLIWQSRKERSSRRRALLKAERRRRKEDGGGGEDIYPEEKGQEVSDGLRRRQTRVLEE